MHRVYWLLLALLVAAAALPRLQTYAFALPYIDHPDEPAYYVGGLELRGLRPWSGYYDGVPPGYLWLSAASQTLLEPLGVDEAWEQVRALRLLSTLANLVTLVVIAGAARAAAGSGWAGAAAGLTAGALWGFAPLVLTNGVYALPDPWVYLFTALALAWALRSLASARAGRWAFASTLAALVAILVKYPAVPALAPGFIAAALLMTRDRRAGLRTLAAQGLACALVAGWLIFDYGIVFQREGAMVRDAGAQNLLDVGLLANNLGMSAAAIPGGLALLVVSAAVLAARRAPWRPLLLCGALFVLTAWQTNTYARVDAGSIRYVLPGVLGLCVGIGIAAGAAVEALPTRAPLRAAAAVLAPLAVLLAAAPGIAALVADRTRPDTRAVLHAWFDANLEPGNILLTPETDKVFNPDWGGMRLSHGRWVDWFTPDDVTTRSPADWRADGFRYAVIDTPAWAGALPLRTFADARWRGPSFTLARLEGPQRPLEVGFGAAITLTGIDRAGEAQAGGTLRYRFYWRTDATPAANYALFIHLVPPGGGAPLAQADGPPAAPGRDTLTWDDASETLISGEMALTLPPDLPPGEYAVLAGLYDYALGPRLPVAGDAARGDALLLDTVVIAGT